MIGAILVGYSDGIVQKTLGKRLSEITVDTFFHGYTSFLWRKSK